MSLLPGGIRQRRREQVGTYGGRDLPALGGVLEQAGDVAVREHRLDLVDDAVEHVGGHGRKPVQNPVQSPSSGVRAAN